jgi:hypothetical protein
MITDIRKVLDLNKSIRDSQVEIVVWRICITTVSVNFMDTGLEYPSVDAAILFNGTNNSIGRVTVEIDGIPKGSKTSGYKIYRDGCEASDCEANTRVACVGVREYGVSPRPIIDSHSIKTKDVGRVFVGIDDAKKTFRNRHRRQSLGIGRNLIYGNRCACYGT